ncbi:metal-sensitive transcriptional regulator [Selenihalanaerobacter shriftii]|uniref:DNA-binding transcriptional regulator, FrmR family n=1 Tax=Selenihalanaerobacter shriftii TaxID=142842 RepID=A0A1T4QBR7_9FIRM|nr:metal-sensitive transcriptional regulator [Selenihalanaerobacter shriftii]SKA01222.1 DNA-binding transcriptional regulator, FrmR family [Selenihalanaerobacter shriftii]
MRTKKSKQDLLNRLRTIKGHTAGIEKMISQDKDCLEILVQISAIKSSINKIGLAIVEDYAQDCIVDTIKEEGDVVKTLKDMINTTLKFNK